MSIQEHPGLLRRDEVAELLRCSKATVDRLVRSGALPAVYIDRMPRFRAEDVGALIESRRAT